MSRRRAPCAVAFCRGTVPNSGPEDEGLCDKHWRLCDGPLRRNYEAAWEEATRADRIGEEDVDAFIRVTLAWGKLKEFAISRLTA